MRNFLLGTIKLLSLVCFKMGEAGFTNLTGDAVRPTYPGTPNMWTSGTIAYTYSKTITEEVKRNITLAFFSISDKTCVRFEPLFGRVQHPDVVKFDNSESGCFSAVGRMGGIQTVNLGNGCGSIGVILHELMHTLGFYHEHERSDRDMYIDILQDNIEEGAANNFLEYTNTVNGSKEYDYDSITHYRHDQFARYPGLTTIKPKDSNIEINRLGQRNGLSQYDIKRINWLYSCESPVGLTKKCSPVLPKEVAYTQDRTRTRARPWNGVGSYVAFSCKNINHILLGPAKRMCKSDRNWTGPTPYCVQKRRPKVLLYTDFEDKNWSIGWTFNSSMDTNWTENKGLTPSRHTGPYFDHTLESSGGTYIYIEESNRKTGSQAGLVSPEIMEDGQEDVCVMFYYHMLGKDMGRLDVYVRNRKKNGPVFWEVGDKGYNWSEAFFKVPKPSEYETIQPFRVEFMGTRGAGPLSDIAIDDILIGPCSVVNAYRQVASSSTKAPETTEPTGKV